MKSLIIMLLVSIFSTSTFANDRTLETMSSVRSKILDQACNLAQAYRADQCNGKCSLKMGGLKEDFSGLIENLYLGGIISLDGYNTAMARIPSLDGRSFWSDSTRGRKKHIKEACGDGKDAMAAIISGLSTPACKNTGDMATAGQCCLDTSTIYDNYKLNFAQYEPENNCKLSGNTCSKHEDCCSQVCTKRNGASEGRCEIEKSCYVPRLDGEECPRNHPYCEACGEGDQKIDGCKNTQCLEIDHNSNGMGDFANVGMPCSKDKECASDSCIAGKCAYKAVCTVCIPRGEILESSDSTCCSGLIPLPDSKGKTRCITTLPPFILPSNVKAEPTKEEKQKNAIQTVLDLISYLNPFPSAHARQDVLGLEETMDRFSNGGGGTSGGGGGTSGNGGGGECLGYGSDGLTVEQRTDWEKCMTDANKVSGEGRLAMFENCDMKKRRWLEENRQAKAGNDKIGNGQDCDGGGQLTRQDYANLYDVPAITTKTFSDVKECEFNSFNDSWRSASNMERNAEITLRAFEAVYSGKGTVDYIIDNEGKSIYEKAQRVALKLRENRYDLIKSFQELDQKMSCKCLAVFGPNNNWEFKNNTIAVNEIGGTKLITKREYFGQYCDGEQDYVQEDQDREVESGTGGDKLAKEKKNEKNDENFSGSAENDTEKKLMEADKGSVGLTHEKLIVEWLGLKRDIQMERFKDNSELEEILENLVTFIQEYNWIENEGYYYNRSVKDPPLHSSISSQGIQAWHEPIYSYGVRRLAGWIKFLIAVLIIVAISFIPGMPVLFAWGWALLGYGIGAAVLGGVIGALFIKKESGPKIYDYQFSEKKGTLKVLGIPIFHAKYYHRFYRSPFYDNQYWSRNVLNTDQHCVVHSTNGSCVKSIYLVDHKFSDDMNFEKYPLLDPVMPVTAKSGDFRIEDTFEGKTYAELMEEAYQNGIQAIKDTKPGTKKHCSNEGRTPLDGGTMPCVKAGSSFQNYDPIADKEVMKHFGIKSGNWTPDEFVEDLQARFKKSIVRYAMCRKLAGDYKGAPCVTMQDMSEDIKAVGFGYLFEQEKDAKDFAEYAYAVHFVWPHLSADKHIGYPLLGQEAYFANILYNLKLVGSIAMKRSMEAYGAYSLYKSSYDKRRGDYGALRGATEGKGSRNAGIPDEVYAQFKGLNFNNDVNMEKFAAKMDELSKSDQFDESSRGLFASASKAFIRRANDIKKRKAYDEVFGNTERGKIKKKNISKFSNLVNSPLQNMALNVGRQNLGNVPGAIFGPDMQSKDVQNEDAGKKNEVASFQPPKFEYDSSSFDAGYGASYGASSSSSRDYGATTVDPNAGKNAYGMSNTDLEYMLRSAKKDESLYEADPNDSIFRVVSKAYKRNLSRILVLKSNVATKDTGGGEVDEEKDKLSDKKKESLKNLLEQ